MIFINLNLYRYIYCYIHIQTTAELLKIFLRFYVTLSNVILDEHIVNSSFYMKIVK